eukprot:maker-scaffold_6-snap-gene-20.57-mRNA-1 protein AED:0.03 eAED:0.03 QI:59/0.8/0.83/1/1/1/6/35/637
MLRQISKSRFQDFQANKPFKFEYDIDKLYGTNYLNVQTLPLPELGNTIQVYLNNVKNLVNEDTLKVTEQAAQSFLGNEGPKLHEKLKGIAKLGQEGQYPYSYIEKYWDEMYLGGRWSIPINSNPFYIINKDPVDANNNLISRSARILNSTAKFWLKVRSGQLEADVDFGTKEPLCMYQFSNLLGSARIPGKGMDKTELYPFSKHIIVLKDGDFYKLDIFSSDNEVYSVASLETALKAILDKKASEGPDVGLLTTLERDAVADLRSELLSSSSINEETFKAVDESLFVLSLEDNEDSDINVVSSMALTGQIKPNGKINRWFDKHTVIVDKLGSFCVNFEHSAGDGLTWNRWMTEIWFDMIGKETGIYSPLNYSESAAQPLIIDLIWEVNDVAKGKLDQAATEFQGAVNNLDVNVLEFDKFGRKHIKNWKVSPDAVSQVAMQLAYHKTHSVVNPQTGTEGSFYGVPVYEACAMKSYFHGRTETIRSSTAESLKFCEAVIGNKGTREERAELFLKACKTHIDVAKGAKSTSGPYQGVDRHLYALKCLAEEEGLSTPQIFTDPSYNLSSNWILSTSNVTTPFFDLFGFGAVTANGYGIGYQTLDDVLPFCITSYKDSTDGTNSSRYANNLGESLEDIDNLF